METCSSIRNGIWDKGVYTCIMKAEEGHIKEIKGWGGAMTMRRRGSESGKMPSGMTHVKRTSRTGRQRIWDRGRMDPFSHWFLNI